MNFYRWQLEMAGNVGVFEAESFLNRPALNHLRRKRRRGDSRSATKSLKFGIFDQARFFVHFNLQLDDIAAGGFAHESGADLWIGFIKSAHVARVFKMIMNFGIVESLTCRKRPRPDIPSQRC